MKKIYLYFLLIAFFSNCSEDKLDFFGKGIVTGKVVQANSFEPVENAKVSLSPSNNTVFTNQDGDFRFEEVEEGDYSVSATKENYLTVFESVQVTADSEINVIFEMEDDNYLNKPPSKPELIFPVENSKNNNLSLELSWSSNDTENDELTYAIEIKNDKNDDVIHVNDITDSKYQLNDLKYGVKYFWQVTVTDDINEPVLSKISNFSTKVNPENRLNYVRESDNGNLVIYSGSISDQGELENEVQLTSNIMNAWRPRRNQENDLIAFLSFSNNEVHIFTMDLNGENIQQVTNSIPVGGVNFSEMDYSWSENGDRILYSNYQTLYEINKDGSGLREVYKTNDNSNISEVVWSADESKIVLKTNDLNGYQVKVFVIDATGVIVNTILDEVDGAAGGIDISVDNKYVLYTYDSSGFESDSYRILDSKIYLFNLNTSEVKSLSADKMNGTIDLDPRFSPNEASVIFVNTSNDGISEKFIYTMELTDEMNKDTRKLLIEKAIMPDWE